MKIIAYNINRYSQEKVDKILAMGADVFILPEVAYPKMVNLPEGYQMEWMGTFTNIPLDSYSLMEWDKDMSDHVGQIIIT